MSDCGLHDFPGIFTHFLVQIIWKRGDKANVDVQAFTSSTAASLQLNHDSSIRLITALQITAVMILYCCSTSHFMSEARSSGAFEHLGPRGSLAMKQDAYGWPQVGTEPYSLQAAGTKQVSGLRGRETSRKTK